MPGSSTNKFKVGDKVKVIKCVWSWPSPYRWHSNMTWAEAANKAIGHAFEIKEVRTSSWGAIDYRLNTHNRCGWDWLFPEESLEPKIKPGQQLLFSFMKGG